VAEYSSHLTSVCVHNAVTDFKNQKLQGWGSFQWHSIHKFHNVSQLVQKLVIT